MAERSSWETTSGLLDHQEGVIESAWFATSADYQDGQVLMLNFKVAAEDGDEYEVSYPCGKGWESTDGGKTAHDEGGKQGRLFHKRSLMGILIDHLVSSEDKPGPQILGGKPGLGLAETLQKRGEAYEAKTYEGLRFFWEGIELDFGINRETKERMTTERTFPTKFLGVGPEGGKVKQKSVAKVVEGDERPADDDKAAKVAAAKAKAASKANGNGGGLREQLVELAKNTSTHAEFIDQAMDLEGVIDDEDLMAEIVEETALYAEARA
jgi:hypothetical protein